MVNATSNVASPGQGVISNEQYTIIVGCFSVTWMVVCTLGFVGNVINIMTFVTMKLEDGVTVSFLVLSITDLCFCVTMFLRAASSLFYMMEMLWSYAVWFLVDPYTMYIFFANFGIVLYIMTVLTTTFLAVARCMCVAKPLHFKNTFTRYRCIVILTGYAIFTFFSYLPIFVNMGLLNQYDARIKAYRPMLWVSSNRELVKDIVWGARDTFLPMTTQVIVIVCVIVMAHSLRESNKFRQSSRCVTESVKSISDNSKDSNKLSRKDLQVVKQVALISCVYIFCNIPKIIVNIAGIFEPDLTIGKHLHNMYLVSVSLAEIFQIFNSSINVFIYYKYNSKFRSCCPVGQKTDQ